MRNMLKRTAALCAEDDYLDASVANGGETPEQTRSRTETLALAGQRAMVFPTEALLCEWRLRIAALA
jgi:hypothetical protein